ncbi:MarR family transcriptional regulator [Kitasatospora camelliae]|uniref:MarR family transcriptional regulator n=1 Tax=Kitasatospora camelliae TaxID=3156397 RepID=A0AAU8K4I9_9ACTN
MRVTGEEPTGLATALALAAGDPRPCALAVAGDPGGVVHLSGGAVTAVLSPGAPDAVRVLLASGRVSEHDWSTLQHPAATGRLGPELLSRALVGPQELQVVCMMAAADAAFAMAAGRIEGCTPAATCPSPALAAPQGIAPDWLLQETERRLAALASLRTPLSPGTDRVRATPAARTSELPGARRDILRYADGRLSAGGIALLLGRGLFAVTIELSRMAGEGLVEVAAPEPAPQPHPCPQPYPQERAVADQPPPPRALGRLPLRRRGASGINDVLPLRPLAARHARPADRAP